MRALQQKGAERGNFEDTRDEILTKTYACLNKLAPDQDGVSMGDFNAAMGVWMTLFAELKAANGM